MQRFYEIDLRPNYPHYGSTHLVQVGGEYRPDLGGLLFYHFSEEEWVNCRGGDNPFGDDFLIREYTLLLPNPITTP